MFHCHDYKEKFKDFWINDFIMDDSFEFMKNCPLFQKKLKIIFHMRRYLEVFLEVNLIQQSMQRQVKRNSKILIIIRKLLNIIII